MPHTQVLVVGGGLVRLSAALLLNHHGIDHVLVERRDGPSVLPRSRGVHQRTVEIFRQLGVEERVQEAAASVLKAGHFGGAWTGASMVAAQELDLSHLMSRGMAGDPSPSRFCFCPQVFLEPVLADIARERGGDLRFGVELTGLVPSDTGVVATLSGADGVTTLDADHVIAADGGASPIRTMLGITSWTLPPTHHYLNLFVRADLTELLAGRGFSQCEVVGDRVRGVITSCNNTDEWGFHIEYDPATESIDDFPEDRCVELVQAAIGTSEVPVQLLARSAWDTGVAVADEYRRGRVFLAGDAAHQHAPWGGFGANTGIADVHNLVWKLGAVLDGRAGLDGSAGEALLDSYAAERRPRAVTAATQARLRTEFHARYGIPTAANADSVADQVDMAAIMTRFRYGADDSVAELTGQVGTRLPHVWVRPDVSTLDLVERGFTLLAGPDAPDWAPTAAAASSETGTAVTVHRLDRESGWAQQNGLPDDGALLVRPDQHVAARSDEGLSPATMADALAAVAARRPHASSTA